MDQRRMFVKILAMCLLVCMLFCNAGMILPIIAEDVNMSYIVSDYLMDFVNPDNAASVFIGAHNVSVENAEDSVKFVFWDTGDGNCDDPYISIRLPSSAIDCEKYPYLAMLVKTNKSDIRGEWRFKTTKTDSGFPCQAINYQNRSEWQLMVCKLTDLSTVYYAPNYTPYTGNYTELRLDMFDNFKGNIPANTEYYIKALAFYKTAEEAAGFINFKSDYVAKEEETFDVNYADFWLGEEFADPANSKRMNWLSYGFTGVTAPVDQFLKEGYGGIVSNVNFNQKYLMDPEEFAILKKVYDYAAGKGMTLWIYDEYQWPSGKAYGLVLDAQPERLWESTGIEHIVVKGSGGTASYKLGATHGTDVEIGIMQAILTDGSGSINLNVGGDGKVSAAASGNWTLDLYVLRYTYDGGEDRTKFDTLRDVDLLNPDAVKYFIEITHEQYKKYLGESFENITAFFTDEPQLGNRDMKNYVVWTGGLAEKFYETYGYHINLPSLFSGSSDYDRMVRLNYYQLVATMFKESYIDQVTAWCEANGVAASGHLLFEENMNDHIETYGGNFMQIVGGMTIPGADVLWVDPGHLLRDNNIGSFMGLRYVSSAAKNAGKNNVMVEYSPNATNTLQNNADVLGVSIGGLSITRLMGTNIYNVINPTKDYSMTQINKLNTYIGRLNTILDETVECGSLAVFYPIATVQAAHDADRDHSSTSGKSTNAVNIDDDFQSLCLTLLQNQYLFTVLDDESICNAKINKDGRLVVGNGCYSTIILPYTEYISVEALRKLADFEAAGGVVFFYKTTPAYALTSGGEEQIASIMAGFKNEEIYSLNSLMKSVRSCVVTNLSVEVLSGKDKALLMGDFESADRDVTFLVNTGDTKMNVEWSYTDGFKGVATIYYPGSGNIVSVDMSHGAMEITIPAYEGVLVVREDENDLTHGIEEAEETTQINSEETTESGSEETSQQVGTDKKGGCKSVAGGSVIAVAMSAIACGVAFSKRREKTIIE